MLNNPNWDKMLPVTDLPSDTETVLKLLAAWLETKNPLEHYEYTDHHNCMCCQFFKEVIGLDIDYVDASNYALKSDLLIEYKYPPILNEIAYGDSAFRVETYFGMALNRTRKALADIYKRR